MSFISKESIYAFFREMRKGRKALVTQSYTEANVKNGVQFQYSDYDPALAASGVKNYIFTTGAKPVAMKGRTLMYDGLGVKIEVMASPDFTGGTLESVHGFNAINQEASTAQITKDPTLNDLGVPALPARYYIGSNAGGSRTAAVTAEEAFGLETILAPNTTYLIQITSLDTSDTQRLSMFYTWYEGDFDLPSN